MEHLKRCKTSTFVKVSFIYIYIYFFGSHLIYSFSSQAQVSCSLGRLVRSRFFLSKQGAAGEHCSQRPTKTLQCSCENVPAIFHFRNGNRPSQEPARGFFNRLKSKSLYGFRNLQFELHQNSAARILR